ncbi:hypothetical protein CRV08_01975 [Halarcobacter ebronensis]|uniref:Uncharacterized protein n=1 Tax=Halarcobacter ebronensis TaxID=1462615 RepID=A0A4Q0YI27_9BACT|nr:ABC-type transport auxiliary lipoprotein family protein [Halarcobacter ebronensis]RXJ70356.1 hypothetical protein CRV08_01975 [Halarcobacter ebronensis]
MRNSLIAILVATLFSGCISITKELPSFTTYNLSIENKINNDDVYIDKSINIYEPKTIESLNSRDILYVQNGLEFNKYALSKWLDKPSKLLQKQVANYLSLNNSYKYITTSNLKVDSDYSLVSELVDFSQEFKEDNSFAKFSIRIYLIDNKNDKTYYKNFTYYEKTPSNDSLGFVKAINKVTNNFYENLNIFIKNKLK